MTATVNLSSLDLAIVRRGVFVALYLCREQQKSTRTRFILLLGSPPPPHYVRESSVKDQPDVVVE